MRVAYTTEGHFNPPKGVRAGHAGPSPTAGSSTRSDTGSRSRSRRARSAGRASLLATNGGGGYGDPLDREPVARGRGRPRRMGLAGAGCRDVRRRVRGPVQPIWRWTPMPPRSSAAASSKPRRAAARGQRSRGGRHATVPDALAWWAGATPDALALSQATRSSRTPTSRRSRTSWPRRLAAAGAADRGASCSWPRTASSGWSPSSPGCGQAGIVAAQRAGSAATRWERQLDACEPRLVSRPRRFVRCSRRTRRTNRPRARAGCRSLLGVGPPQRG